MSCSNDCNCGSCCPGPKGEDGKIGNQGPIGPPGIQGLTGLTGGSGGGGTAGTDGDDGFGYNSVSANSIGVLDTASATENFTIDSEKAYTAGARVRMSDTGNPTGNYFEGIVTAYNDATGAITVSVIDVKVGSGTHASWNINLAGDIGSDGATGSQGIQGPDGPQGIQGPIGNTGADGAAGDSGADYKSLYAVGAAPVGITGTGSMEDLATITIPAGTLGSLSGLRFKFNGDLGSIGVQGDFEVRINGNVYGQFNGTFPDGFRVDFEVMMETVVSNITNISVAVFIRNQYPNITSHSQATVGINDWSSVSNDIVFAARGVGANDVILNNWTVEKMYF